MRHVIVSGVLGAALAAGVAQGAPAVPSGSVEGSVRVNPLSVVLLVPPDPQRAGRVFRIRAEVANAGSTTVQDVAVTLVASPALRLRDPRTHVLPRIRPADTRRVGWNACSTAADNYLVVARATAGPFAVESTAQLVQVVPADRARC